MSTFLRLKLANLLTILRTPEYLFNPPQLLYRLTKRWQRMPTEQRSQVRLPWGLELDIDREDAMGLLLWELGIYDLILCETIWRLLDPGEHAADVGANIGYITGLMAARTGRTGTVTAFEPHPLNYEDLVAHVRRWQAQAPVAAIETHQCGLSDQSGTGLLGIPDDFLRSRGSPTLSSRSFSSGAIHQHVEIPLRQLDEVLGDAHIALLKIDVEDHEIQVLRGAQGMLAKRQIREVVFEDHGRYPTASMALLEEHGYTLFYLGKGLFGPGLLPASLDVPRQTLAPPNYLATAAPGRAVLRMRPRGWAMIPHSPFIHR